MSNTVSRRGCLGCGRSGGELTENGCPTCGPQAPVGNLPGNGRGPGEPYDDERPDSILRPPAGAVGLSAMRALRSGAARQYTAVEFVRGWGGVEHFIRTLLAVGYVKPSSIEPCYAVLDVLDADGDVLGDYAIPNSRAFAYVKRKLKLRVVDVAAEVERHRREQASGEGR